jgi:ectoine hydroxylase-related dioxygenase (phytanoyl-CoA dioxygenase family)
MTPKNSGQADDMNFFINLSARCEKFVHVTGKVGDCYLLHPLTLHTASRNCTRVPRVILNPAVSLAEPFNFDRANSDDYSLVERKTLLALGKPEGLKGWRVTGKREHVTPARIRLQATLKALELRRLRGEAVDATTNDGLGGKGLADVNRLEE